jgi:hypothetical protein
VNATAEAEQDRRGRGPALRNTGPAKYRGKYRAMTDSCF